jgi:hypothetical protein
MSEFGTSVGSRRTIRARIANALPMSDPHEYGVGSARRLGHFVQGRGASGLRAFIGTAAALMDFGLRALRFMVAVCFFDFSACGRLFVSLTKCPSKLFLATDLSRVCET